MNLNGCDVRKDLIELIFCEETARKFFLETIQTNCVNLEVFKNICFAKSENKFFAKTLIDIIAAACPRAEIIESNFCEKNALEEMEGGNNAPSGFQEINEKEIEYPGLEGDLDDNFIKYLEGLKGKKIIYKKREKIEREPKEEKLNIVQIYFKEAQEKNYL